MRHHAALLQNVAQTYGVPAHYIAAIAGVETNFGSYTGRFPTLGTLATLAFEHPRRQTYFRKELAHYLRLSYSQDFDPLTVRGSPAGAMGMAQFMPSSYQAYAVDGDGDGDIDLLTSVADSLASIANYLVRHGWQGEKPVWLAIEAQNPINEVSNKPKPGGKSLAAWQAKGIRLVTPLAELERNKVEYRLYPFTTHAETEYILATGNFYAITRYNHSLWYARLVAELADAINK
jgi:membrane-bound lytic murein transglycosylase B